MSTKKVVRIEKQEAEKYEKKMTATRRVGLMAVLAAALAGPIAAAPIEDPRRPRERAAWTPTPTGHGKRGRQGAGNLNSGPTSGALEGEERAAKPTVFLMGGAKPDSNLYVRRIRNGPGILDAEVYEFGNRLKDRKRELEGLMRDLGIPVSHRQVKRILRGFMPPRLIAWLDAKKALEEAATPRPSVIGDEWEVDSPQGKRWVVRQVAEPVANLDHHPRVVKVGILKSREGHLYEGWITDQGVKVLRVTMADGTRLYARIIDAGATPPMGTWTYTTTQSYTTR